MINFFLTALVAYTGVILGVILAYSAKEEIKPGKKYFLLMQKILFIAIIASIIIFLVYSNRLIAMFLIIVLTVVYYLKMNNLPATYILFSLISFLSSTNQTALIITSSLIFLYGIPTGTMQVDFRNMRKTAINILVPSIYVIASSAIYIIGSVQNLLLR